MSERLPDESYSQPSPLACALRDFLRTYRTAEDPGCLREGLNDIIAANGGYEAARAMHFTEDVGCRACYSEVNIAPHGQAIGTNVPCPYVLPATPPHQG